MAKVKLTSKVDSEILVVGLAISNKKLQIESGSSQIESASLLATLNAMGATGKADEVIKLPGKNTKLVVFTGLGEIKSAYDPENLRRAAGAAARDLNGNKSATFSLPHKSVVELAAIAEGAALGSYTFTEFLGSSKQDQKEPLSQVSVISKFADTAQAKAAAKRAEIIAEQTYLVRDLINTPPSHLTPDSFSQQLKKLSTKYGVKAEIFNDASLKKGGYGEKVVISGSEEVKNWEKVQDGVWKAILPNTFFGSFNPFAEIIAGDWFHANDRIHHVGAVYLNGDWLTEAVSLEAVLKPMTATPLWFAIVDTTNTVIWAQFKDVDPNGQQVEVNARRSVFYPDKPGRNYITVRDFTLRNAATPWAPPTVERSA